MTKNILAGLIAGAGIAAVIASLISLQKRNNGSKDKDFPDENELLDKANDYLLDARNKVDKMIREAEEKSVSILHEAGKLLSLVKENTAEMHNKFSHGIEEEAEKLRQEIEESIEKFRISNLK
ncbi:MAG: hypothetical protein JNJ56_09255 [Ignavibacteria bacterium]|nr:hypothetical protein [Ignavibacteria bacterium]